MNERIEKANFYLETQEYQKADKIFSKIFDEDDTNQEAIIGLMLTKLYEGNLKASKLYFKKLDLNSLENDKRENLRKKVLKTSEKLIDNRLQKLRETANELSKRPALTGQFVAVKELNDATDHMSNVNDATEEFDKILEVAGLAYSIENRHKEDVALDILSLFDKIFENIGSTPSMPSNILLGTSKMKKLKVKRENWRGKAGKKGENKIYQEATSGGCLLLIMAMSILSIFVLNLI